MKYALMLTLCSLALVLVGALVEGLLLQRPPHFTVVPLCTAVVGVVWLIGAFTAEIWRDR